MQASEIAPNERASLLGSLGWLRYESISGAGRRLIEQRLPDRTFGGVKASQFFAIVYDLRSRLVHGGPSFPSFEEIASKVGDLELMVAELLTAGEPA